MPDLEYYVTWDDEKGGGYWYCETLAEAEAFAESMRKMPYYTNVVIEQL